MFDELSKEHEVYFYTPGKNTLFPEMPKANLSIDYDLGLINHRNSLSNLRGKNIRTRVMTCHGVIPFLEQPLLGADSYVSVSEELEGHLRSRGFSSHVLRNPINLSLFRPTHPPPVILENVLFISNHQGPALSTIHEATEGLNLRIVGRENFTMTPWEDMNWAQLVITLGRGVYEAMACGRNVVIYDYRGGDGFVTPENIFKYREKNCSGRTNKSILSGPQLREWINMYDASHYENFISYAHEHHDVRQIAKEYLNL